MKVKKYIHLHQSQPQLLVPYNTNHKDDVIDENNRPTTFEIINSLFKSPIFFEKYLLTLNCCRMVLPPGLNNFSAVMYQGNALNELSKSP